MFTLTIDNRKIKIGKSDKLLTVLKEQDIPIMQACGGNGRCATCHLYVIEGADALSPQTEQEYKTLKLMNLSHPNVRLACQTSVLSEGVVIELPKGTFVESEQTLESLIGKKAFKTLIHPLTGEVLVEEGKLILRTAVEKMHQASDKFAQDLSQLK